MVAFREAMNSLGRFWEKSCTPSSARQVVVTGIGIVSPLGNSLPEFWSNLVAGSSGIDFIQGFDASSFPCRIAAEVRSVRFRDYLSRAQLGYYPKATQLACVALAEAKLNSGIDQFDPRRTDVWVGSSSNAFDYIDKEAAHKDFSTFASFDPTGIMKLSISCTAAALAARENVRGYVGTLSTACASGITALGLAMDRIRVGLSDMAIVGATDIGVTRFLLSLFCSAKFVSFAEDPSCAVRPFDINSTRSVLGDGACVFILETEHSARQRRAKMYGRLVSFAQAYENNSSLFEADKTGKRWSETMADALSKVPGDVDYVNAHGPGDQTLDAVEIQAIEMAFAGSPPPLISSIKGAIGSPFAAAGAFQVVSTLLSLEHGLIPPSCGLTTPITSTKLPFVTTQPHRSPIKRALVNSRGVGGVNTSIICERVERQ